MLDRAREQALGILVAAQQKETLCEPERGKEERAFPFREAVVELPVAIALDETVVDKIVLDRLNRGPDTGVVCWEKADQRQPQETGVDLVGAVEAHEATALPAVALQQHVLPDLVTELPPSLDWPVLSVSLNRLHRAVDGEPSHDLRVDEVSRFRANLPEAVVGITPVRRDELDKLALQWPRPLGIDAGATSGAEEVHHLAVLVELELARRVVANAHRSGPLVAAEPVELVFDQQPLLRDAVQDLDVIGIAANRPQQPVMPFPRLVRVSVFEQQLEDEGRIPEPAVAVVPISNPADDLRERGGGRSDDPARRRVRESLQGEQAADDLVAPFTVIGATARVAAPERVGAFDKLLPVGRRRIVVHFSMRRPVGRDKRDVLAFRHVEMCARAEVVQLERGVATKLESVSSARGYDHVSFRANPGGHRAVVEARTELHAQSHRSSDASNHTQHCIERPDLARILEIIRLERHAVEEGHRAARRLEDGLEHHAVVPVRPLDRAQLVVGGDAPAAASLVVEESRKTGLGVETRQAQPVDRTLEGYERSRTSVADQCVGFEACQAESSFRGGNRAGSSRSLRA